MRCPVAISPPRTRAHVSRGGCEQHCPPSRHSVLTGRRLRRTAPLAFDALDSRLLLGFLCALLRAKHIRHPRRHPRHVRRSLGDARSEPEPAALLLAAAGGTAATVAPFPARQPPAAAPAPARPIAWLLVVISDVPSMKTAEKNLFVCTPRSAATRCTKANREGEGLQG